MAHKTRRWYLASIGGLSVVGVAGCSEDEPEPDAEPDAEPEPQEHEVIAGPDGSWAFDPEELTIRVGDTVTWYFDSAGHNVTAHPDAASDTQVPDGAEPFASYEGDNHLEIVSEGDEYSHTFDVPGEYVYVCTPHIPQMTGSIVVEE